MVRSVIGIVAIMSVVGWPATGTPFRGDQVVYVLAAKRMAEGAILYRDVWDVTNPGVFWFYRLAGNCFGFTEDGIHLFEWLYWLAFVFAVSFAAKRKNSLTSLPFAPAFLIGGVYYLTATSDPNFLTRAEGLAGFPFFLATWFACRAAEGRASFRWALFAGVAGGVAILIKLAFGSCVVAGWLIPAVIAYRSRCGLRVFAGLGVGTSTILGTAALTFAVQGGGSEWVETTFVVPGEILAVAEPAAFSRLAASVRRFFEVFSTVLTLAVVGGTIAVRRTRDPFVPSLALVFVAAVAVILIQRWSWWDYHFLLLGIPAATVAAYCWPELLLAARVRLGRPLNERERFLIGLTGALLFLPVLGHGANAYLRLVPNRFGFTAAGRSAARMSAGNAYRIAKQETDWLAGPDALPGPIFVAGDPCFHWLSGHPQATRFNGWSPELFPPRQWDALLGELRANEPAYVFVSGTEEIPCERIIRDRAPAMRVWLDGRYEHVRTSPNGTWYRRKK